MCSFYPKQGVPSATTPQRLQLPLLLPRQEELAARACGWRSWRCSRACAAGGAGGGAHERAAGGAGGARAREAGGAGGLFPKNKALSTPK